MVQPDLTAQEVHYVWVDRDDGIGAGGLDNSRAPTHGSHVSKPSGISPVQSM